MPSTPDRPLVVVNFNAARARRAWPRIREQLTRGGLRFDTDAPAAPGDTESSVRRALREGYRVVAVVGGDGTLGEAARGFFEAPAGGAGGSEPPAPVNPSAALAILPAGTGDDFARGLAARRAPLDEWLRRLLAHRQRQTENEKTPGETARELADTTRRVDVLYDKVDGGARRFVCLNAATLGVGAEVAARVAAQGASARRLPGEARFALAAVGALVAWRNRPVRIELDDAPPFECETNLIAVTNGPYAGGGMNFAPGARPDDGRLEALTVCRISRAGLVRELARVHRGGHLGNPKVVLCTGTRVRVTTLDAGAPLPVEADGDPRGRTPAAFRVMPAALSVVW
ncbi:MAG TPA: diacylglycerol kinase family protein [Pyrinomonadaceae bacterium]|nr:diacylglycerol kinase family protein [Pyrinomonadaceae bacterium]